MMLGKTSSAGRPANLDNSRHKPSVLALGAGQWYVNIFLSSITVTSLFFLPPSGRRPDIDCSIVSKGRSSQNNQPTKII